MAVQRDKVIASAEKLVFKGKIEPAIKEYERLLDENPNDVNTLNRIGDLWVRINRTKEAVGVYSRIADHYSKDGFFLKAIAIYKKINKLDPSQLEIYARLADLYAKQGLAMEAKSQYQVLADYYLKHNDPANALLTYKSISELDPNAINVHVKLADLHSQVGHTADALKEYDRVGRMLLKRGMLDEAVQVFRKALKIDGKNIDLVESLVTALIEAKDLDNAKKIVEQALESNRENPRLLATWGRILTAKGDPASARTALERALAADPTEPAVREALGELYLKQNNPDRALEMMAPLVERALGKGERGTAVEMLNRILRVDQRHTPTLERLVAVYTRLNEETNILSSMNLLAEAHIAKTQWEQAGTVLDRLIQREPQNAQHRTKLQFVRSKTPGGAAPPVPIRPRTVADVPPMEIEEPEPTFDLPEEEQAVPADIGSGAPEFEISLDDSPSLMAGGVEPESGPSEEETTDDLDFITEHLTEAEVFAKYGLAEKAAEHLRAIIERAPKHLVAHDRLFRILLDEGDTEAAQKAAAQYIAILQEKGDAATMDAVRNEFITRGHLLTSTATPRPAPAPDVNEYDASAVTELTPEEEISFDLEGPAIEIESASASAPASEAVPQDFGSELGFDLGAPLEIEPEPAPEPEIEPAPEPLPDFETTADADVEPSGEAIIEPESTPAEELPIEIEVEPDVQSAEEPLLEIEFAPAQEPPPAFEAKPAEEPALNFDFEPDAERERQIPPKPEAPFFEQLAVDPSPSASPHGPSADEISEIDFYIAQDLLDVAKVKAETLLFQFPGNPLIASVIRRIDNAVAAVTATRQSTPPPAPPPPPAHAPRFTSSPAGAAPPSSLSRAEIESELLSAIPDDDEDLGDFFAAPPPPPAAQEPAPIAFASAPAHEQNLFADEDDFFDLAAELESELEEEAEVVALSEEEQSLEEIFKEFKRGVEQQLDSEDYDTHYNLGIAYKEMGLIDEAIGEFQLASKDPKRAVECASMLGLCFLEKGMPQLAIKWYRKGLEIPEINQEEHIGLLYDLGSAHVEVGDTTNAQKAFMEVYGLNSNYRDVVTRLKQLQDAGRST